MMRALLAWLLLWLAAMPDAMAVQLTQGAHAQVERSERQLLVMLRVPPQHLRPDADYGGTYRSSAGREARQRIARQIAKAHGLHLIEDGRLRH